MTFLQLWKRFRYWGKARLSGVRIPIRSGPLKGRMWGVVTGMRFLRGDYGSKELPALMALIEPGNVFYDIGAHCGYFTLIAADRVGAAGQVIAFEPLPLNQRFLTSHVRANNYQNVKVMRVAVSDKSGHQTFDLAGGSGRGRLGSGKLHVETVSLDELIESGQIPPPDVIKMDIEGAEFLALQGAQRMLKRCRPKIYLATHGAAARENCSRFLTGLGYQLNPHRESDIIATALPPG